jgi:lysophospholipase L1-like esterase
MMFEMIRNSTLMNVCLAMASLFGADASCAAEDAPPADPSAPWVQPGDRVVLVGSGWVERMHHHPWLETMLTLQVRGVTFRNIGWSGDTVYGDARAVFGARSDGYQRLKRDLDFAAPKLAILCYGENEAFGSAEEREQFSAGYRALIQDVLSRDCRIVLVIPRSREKAGPGFPDPSRFNRKLSSIAATIRALAQEFRCGLVDLENFAPNQRFTTDGVAWNDDGYRQSAVEMMKQLGFPQPAFQRWADADPSRVQELNRLIQAKNEWFFHRYRPQNETYLFLFRKHEQGNNAIEVEQMELHVSQSEKEIADWLEKNQIVPQS